MGNICDCCGVRGKGPASLPENASGGNAGYGYALAKNDRTRMEDAVVVNDNVSEHRCYAVVDGHGGDRAAMLLQEMLPSKLGQHLQGSKTKDQAVMDAFGDLDEELKFALLQQEPKAVGRTAGAVACVATIQGKELLLANLGDCRAVVCEGGQVKFATADHSPVSNKLEKERLQALGVAVEGGYVGGELQVTRAFGDLWGPRWGDRPEAGRLGLHARGCNLGDWRRHRVCPNCQRWHMGRLTGSAGPHDRTQNLAGNKVSPGRCPSGSGSGWQSHQSGQCGSRRRGCQCGSGGGGGCGVPARSFPISVMNIYISIYRDTDILFDQ